ncbi:hypothetical protein BH11PSE3_BH11PSE3_00850 [soil metagenome]
MKTVLRASVTRVGRAIALAIWLSCVCLPLNAQDAAQQTSLTRANELVSEHISRARREQDLSLRQRLFTEAYAAKLSLPTEDDLRAEARGLREIARGLWSIDITPFYQEDAERDIIRLNENRYGRARVRHVVHALLGEDDAALELQRYDFDGLIRANNRDEVAAAVVSDETPYRQIARLCRHGKLDLAGYAANKVTSAQWANVTAGFMAELGMIDEAERRASQYLPATNRWRPNGLEMLGKLAVTEARRGHGDTVRRLARMMLDAPNVDLITKLTGNTGLGSCEEKLWDEWPDWHMRSIAWLSRPRPVFNVYPDPGSDRSLAATLGEALAGTGINSASKRLIDQLIAIIDRATAASQVGPLPVGADEKAIGIWADGRAHHLTLGEARKSLMLARVAAGGDVDTAAANALTVKSVARFLYEFPHSGLSARILSFSTAEQWGLDLASPGLAAGLRYMALINEGRAKEARDLELSQPKARESISGVMLQDIAASLQNAGLETRAKAAIDAYLDGQYRPDIFDVYLLLRQGQVDRAKTILRGFVSSDFDSDEVFLGVMLLRELGEPFDLATLRNALRGDPTAKTSNWIAAIDALTWSGASGNIDMLIRNPPSELAALTAADATRMLCTAFGLQAIAFARAGQLESGLRLVTERTLNQRSYRCEGDRRPFFDLRYLVQEWVNRGHAQ